MFKRKRDSESISPSDSRIAHGSSSRSNSDTGSDTASEKHPRLHAQDHQRLACDSNAQTLVLPTNSDDNENPKLFRACTDPMEWNIIKYRDMRSTHARRAFGRALYPPQRMVLERFTCSPKDRYHFCFPDQRNCVPFVCAYTNNACDGRLLAIGDEAKRITLLRTDVGNAVENQHLHETFQAHGNAVLTLKWSNDDTLLMSGAADGNIRLWDVETKACVAAFMGHTSSLRSVDWHPANQNLLVSSSKDGSFMLWDLRHKQLHVNRNKTDASGLETPVYGPIKATKHAHETNNKKLKQKENLLKTPPHSVTSALFMPGHEDQIITSGSHDGAIKIWDCRAGRDAKPFVEYNYDGPSNRPRGIADLRLDHSGTRLFGLCMDGSVNMHHLTNITRPALRFTHPDYSIASFFVKLSVSYDDRFLIAGSSSNAVFAWEIDRPDAPAIKYRGHQREVGSVAWSQKRYQFASCADDGSVRIWDFDAAARGRDGTHDTSEDDE